MPWFIATSESASGNGRGLSRTPLTTAKIAAFAPMPSARVTATVAVTPGVRASERIANRALRHALFDKRNPLPVAVLFRDLRDAADVEPGGAPRLIGRQAARPMLRFELLEMKLELAR